MFLFELKPNTANPPRGGHMVLIIRLGKPEIISMFQTHADFTALTIVSCGFVVVDLKCISLYFWNYCFGAFELNSNYVLLMCLLAWISGCCCSMQEKHSTDTINITIHRWEASGGSRTFLCDSHLGGGGFWGNIVDVTLNCQLKALHTCFQLLC